jgi:hypothetical protein
MTPFIVLISAFVTLLASLPAGASQLNRALAEYSADATIQNEEGTTQQHVYVTPTKERKETMHRKEKEAKRALRKAEKSSRSQAPEGEDPDLAGLHWGPQPPLY